jgi:hypothetical protein
MSETAGLVFTPEGTAVGLYTEMIDLSAIGSLRIKRATTIEFDNKHQVWRVYDLDGFPLYTSPFRHVCLEWEKKHLESQMEGTAS